MFARNPELNDPDRKRLDPASELIAVAERTSVRLREAGEGFSDLERLVAQLDVAKLGPKMTSVIVELRVGCARTATDLTHLLMVAEVCKALAYQAQERSS